MTIAVIDDLEQDQLEISSCTSRFLSEHHGPAPQFCFYSSGEEFIAALSPHFFDIVLLDCCMEGMDGLETARRMRTLDKEASLIFITSCQDFAVDGYLVSAAGYLVKPFEYHSFSLVFDNVYNKLNPKKEFITVPDGNEKKPVFVDEIVYCDICGHYVQIHFPESKIMRIRMTFSALSSLLAPYPQFLECYRGCIVNMDHVHQTEELNFLMDSQERVPFRKKEQGSLLKKYSNYLFNKVRSENI